MGWEKFRIGNYRVVAKVFSEPSVLGIRRGRVSKLEIRTSTGKLVVNYNRGWDIRPRNQTHRNLVNQVLRRYDQKPKRRKK